MDKKFNFTQARIKNLAAPDKGRIDYVDTDTKKLVCRVSHTGNKSFLVTKRVDGKLKNVTIGKFPDVNVTEARNKARKILTSLTSGIDPTAEKRKQRINQTPLKEVLEQCIEKSDLKPSTAKDYRYKLALGFPDWLNKPVNSITSAMVLARHKKISQTGKTTANTTMRVLRLTLNYAKAVEMISDTPTDVLKNAKLWHKNQRKDRVIPSDQLKTWHEAVEALPNEKARVYLLMALYMGFRSIEALKLEWAHIDLENNTITQYNTKNGSDHKLPIPTALQPHINKLKDSTGTHKWVFASTIIINGQITGRPMAVPTKQIKAVTKACGVEFTSHDCRRTFATIAEAVSIPTTMIKRLMNHVTSNDVTGGYIITEEETLRKAINKIAGYIQGRVNQKDNVIQLHG
ncbi:MAG: integrase family protein [Cycloclasticus sp.]|nr:integrase family protein [Cycloclasticus sp.]